MEATLRPISAADFALEKEFVKRLSPQTGYQRLMSARRPSPEELRRWTQPDPEREYVLIATIPFEGRERQVGVARYAMDAGGDAEVAIVVSDEWQGRGLGRRLLAELVQAARARGVRRLYGTTFSSNVPMRELARKLGFALSGDARSASVTNLSLEIGR
jgi:RimJ/RimL family protein N-acetyltransferase